MYSTSEPFTVSTVQCALRWYIKLWPPQSPQPVFSPQSCIQVNVSARKTTELYIQEQYVFAVLLLTLLCFSSAGGPLHVISDACCVLFSSPLWASQAVCLCIVHKLTHFWLLTFDLFEFTVHFFLCPNITLLIIILPNSIVKRMKNKSKATYSIHRQHQASPSVSAPTGCHSSSPAQSLCYFLSVYRGETAEEEMKKLIIL